ncbi:MAG: hypothetical protein PVH96_06880 [Gemmatimonadota bacterium]
MTKHTDDDRMREAFQDLRADTRASGSVPDFQSMMAEAKRRADETPALEVVVGAGSGARVRAHRRFVRFGAWASAAVAAAVAALILVDRAPSGEDDFERLVAAYTSETAAGAWSSPTSSLLDVPGMDLMRSVPSIGEPLRGIDPSSFPSTSASPEEENL